MRTTGMPADATASMIVRVSRVRTPPARAMSLARWMTGPSITGSEYGSSTSMTSQPASAMSFIEAMLCSTVGKPAGMQPTSADRFSAFALANTSAMLTPPPRFAPRRRAAPTCSAQWSARCARSRVLPRHDRLGLVEGAEVRARRVHVLVTAAAEVDDDGRGAAQLGGERRDDPGRPGQGVRALDRRNDALGPAEQLERGHRLGVRHRLVDRPAGVVQPGVLRPDARVVQP